MKKYRFLSDIIFTGFLIFQFSCGILDLGTENFNNRNLNANSNDNNSDNNRDDENDGNGQSPQQTPLTGCHFINNSLNCNNETSIEVCFNRSESYWHDPINFNSRFNANVIGASRNNRVKILLPGSNQPYLEGRTDEEGYFKSLTGDENLCGSFPKNFETSLAILTESGSMGTSDLQAIRHISLRTNEEDMEYLFSSREKVAEQTYNYSSESEVSNYNFPLFYTHEFQNFDGNANDIDYNSRRVVFEENPNFDPNASQGSENYYFGKYIYNALLSNFSDGAHADRLIRGNEIGRFAPNYADRSFISIESFKLNFDYENRLKVPLSNSNQIRAVTDYSIRSRFGEDLFREIETSFITFQRDGSLAGNLALNEILNQDYALGQLEDKSNTYSDIRFDVVKLSHLIDSSNLDNVCDLGLNFTFVDGRNDNLGNFEILTYMEKYFRDAILEHGGILNATLPGYFAGDLSGRAYHFDSGDSRKFTTYYRNLPLLSMEDLSLQPDMRIAILIKEYDDNYANDIIDCIVIDAEEFLQDNELILSINNRDFIESLGAANLATRVEETFTAEITLKLQFGYE